MGKKKKFTGLWFVLPGFTGVMVFYVLPFLDVVRRSFFSAVGSDFCGLKNYFTVLGNGAFHIAAGNTLRFTFICLFLLLGISLLMALGLNRLGQKKKQSAAFLKSMYLIPLALPTASVVLFWKLAFHGKGFLNAMLAGAGISGCDWMNGKTALAVLVFCYIWKNAGYTVVLWLAGFGMVPDSVYEAAKVDGANGWSCFWRITIPIIRPVIFLIFIISLLNSFQVYREVWLLEGNYPAENIYLMQHLFHNWFLSLSMDKMSAGAVLLFLVIVVLVSAMQRIWEK